MRVWDAISATRTRGAPRSGTHGARGGGDDARCGPTVCGSTALVGRSGRAQVIVPGVPSNVTVLVTLLQQGVKDFSSRDDRCIGQCHVQIRSMAQFEGAAGQRTMELRLEPPRFMPRETNGAPIKLSRPIYPEARVSRERARARAARVSDPARWRRA